MWKLLSMWAGVIEIDGQYKMLESVMFVQQRSVYVEINADNKLCMTFTAVLMPLGELVIKECDVVDIQDSSQKNWKQYAAMCTGEMAGKCGIKCSVESFDKFCMLGF